MLLLFAVFYGGGDHRDGGDRGCAERMCGMNEKQLQEIEARKNAADKQEDILDFIIDAQGIIDNDIPALLAEVRRLRAVVENAIELNNKLHGMYRVTQILEECLRGMTELRACPFCDGDRVDYDSMLFTQKGKVIYAKCPDCGASFRVLEHIYNMRVNEDSLQAAHEKQAAEIAKKDAEIERLNKALDEITDRRVDLYGGTNMPFTLVTATQFYALQAIARAAREREAANE